MRPAYQILLIAIAVLFVGFAAFQAGLTASSTQLGAALIFVAIIGAVIYALMRQGGASGDPLGHARQAAIEWWRERFSESLSKIEEFGETVYFGRTRFFGFTLTKLHGGQPVSIVMVDSHGKPNVYTYSSSPTPKVRKNPFALVQSEYLPSPVPLDEPIPRFAKWHGFPGYSSKPHVSVNVGRDDDEEWRKARGKKP